MTSARGEGQGSGGKDSKPEFTQNSVLESWLNFSQLANSELSQERSR